MKQLFALILSIVFFLIMISCTMDNSSRTKFPWEPAVAAPINYPVETQYTLVGYGTNGRELSVMEQTPRSGISDPSDGAGVLEDDPGFDLPNSLSILWLSCTEQKFYKADIKFSKELQDKILRVFQEGFVKRDYNRKATYTTYTDFIVTMLPHGHIWLYVWRAERAVLATHCKHKK